MYNIYCNYISLKKKFIKPPNNLILLEENNLNKEFKTNLLINIDENNVFNETNNKKKLCSKLKNLFIFE